MITKLTLLDPSDLQDADTGHFLPSGQYLVLGNASDLLTLRSVHQSRTFTARVRAGEVDARIRRKRILSR